MTTNDAFSWTLVSRYALLVALTELIPIPLVDGFAAELLRRRLTRLQLEARGLTLDRSHIDMLGGSNAGGCLGLVFSLAVWPFKKALGTVLFVLLIRKMVNVFSDVVHRALLLHEAMDQGLDLTRSAEVRAAMNRAMGRVDTRATERALGQVFNRSRRELLGLARAFAARVRREARAEQEERHATDADRTPLDESPELMTAALAEAVRVPGVEADLIRAFQDEISTARGR